jgi:hypothetical protein
MVENIRDSVTAYYGQFEEAAPAAEPELVEMEPAAGEPLGAAEGEADAPAAGQDLAESAAPAEAAPPQDVEMAGESDTIIDSGRVSHDESEDGGSQNE